MRPTSALFDLDGTLIDHFQAIYRCHAYAFRQLGLPEPTFAEVHAAVGGGLDEAIAKLGGTDKVEALRPHFLRHWKETNLDDVTLLPGAKEVLQALRAADIPCAVLTNKRGYAARDVCNHLGITPLLVGVFGADDTPWIKPNPEFTRHALAAMGVPAAGSVLVGDSPFDVATAHNFNLRFVGVTTGTHTRDQLKAAGADVVVDNLAAVQRELGVS